MEELLAFTIVGIVTGSIYAVAAGGLVLTYTTTRVFNIAHGAFGMVLSFLFWDFSVRQGLPIWLSSLGDMAETALGADDRASLLAALRAALPSGGGTNNWNNCP